MYSRSRSGGDVWVSMVSRAAVTSAAVVTAAVALRLAGPPVVWFLASEIPRAYDSALAWLRPPYLYLVINGIIISIAASSRFQNQSSSAAAHQIAPMPQLAAMDPATVVQAPEYEANKLAEDAPTEEIGGRVKAEVKDEEAELEEEFVISRSSWSPKRRRGSTEETSTERSANMEEKPLVTARFANRKAAKPSPEGKALGVARRPRRNETLESTWRTITEGRAVPLARHLKKSETWDARGGPREEAAAPAMRKCETFNDRGAGAASPVSGGSSSAGRLRREASLGHDELNRRVEAFIKKFNEEMRLQRLESVRHYREMVKRDSH
ncbi:hypothetical protein Cni_G26881 [Canna indica]|uniref:DUF4408 domain-containing protein n=1 Tax=Canna indica TaxID=4628 RepID=A0AAQ3QQU3_9LILI|nr:hypothetical protein Cni_G26881 [Canna indica]